MYTERKSGKTRIALLRIIAGLLGAYCLGLVGCGGGSSSSSHADSSEDFAIRIEPASANALIKGGQTTPVTLDLISANGFPHPVTLSITNGGIPTAFVTPTLPSLPKGTTKVVLNINAPATVYPALGELVGYVSATGGGLTRYLNSGVFGAPANGQLILASPGILLYSQGPYYMPFRPSVPFQTTDLTGTVPIVGAGLNGPVTVTLTNPTSGIAATLAQSTFTPTGPNSAINTNVTINLHIPTPIAGGAYPFTLTATAPDGSKSTYTVYLFVLTMAFASPPTLTVTNIGTTTSITAPLTITGPPGVSFPLTVTSPLGSGLTLTLSPTAVTIPASGTITQPLTIQAELYVSAAPATYTVNIMGSVSSSFPETAPFTLKVQ